MYTIGCRLSDSSELWIVSCKRMEEHGVRKVDIVARNPAAVGVASIVRG